MLEEEYKYFKTHKKELLENYRNKFVVIKNKEVIGAYDTEKEAASTLLLLNVGEISVSKKTISNRCHQYRTKYH